MLVFTFDFSFFFQKIYIPGDNDIGGELPDIRTVEKEKRFERHFENITGLVKFGFIDYVKVPYLFGYKTGFSPP